VLIERAHLRAHVSGLLEQFRACCSSVRGRWARPLRATQTGPEHDVLMLRYGKRVGVEFKYADTPRLTPSMRIAATDLKLDALYVVYPGDRRYPLADNIEAVPLAHFVSMP
jgi:predicted AAA+ superfamily ATPase